MRTFTRVVSDFSQIIKLKIFYNFARVTKVILESQISIRLNLFFSIEQTNETIDRSDIIEILYDIIDLCTRYFIHIVVLSRANHKLGAPILSESCLRYPYHWVLPRPTTTLPFVTHLFPLNRLP